MIDRFGGMNMDIGTILLIAAALVGVIDTIILLAGPRIFDYEKISFFTALVGFLSAVGAMLWMGIIIFTDNFVYEYVYSVTERASPWWLKVSGLWAGQSGSLVFWGALAFILYFGFRALTRGYEDDQIVYRASILMVFTSVLIVVNAIVANPFRVFEGSIPTDGLGMNPLLRTPWNAIHPPIVFIAYALLMVPFAIKLAGFTLRSDERNADSIPVVERVMNLTTVASWLMLSVGIAIGGYWAYIVLGWGGYWAWDPVETSSLIPWLLLTGYYHAKAVFRKNDVLRDSFLVFSFVTVIFATWVTRSGVLTSVHGFQTTPVTWTMLGVLLFVFIISTIFTLRAGLVDLEDEDEESSISLFSLSNIRDFSIKLALIGILIITAVSVVGIVMPASLNLGIAIFDPASLEDSMVAVGIDFFRTGFYVGSIFVILSAFYCMKTTLISERRKGYIIIVLLAVGGVLGFLSYIESPLISMTSFWAANALIPVGFGAIIYLLISFGRMMAGREPGPFTMRRMGRLMLHLGLIVLLVGVFASENVVYEDNSGYLENEDHEIAPGISIRVDEIDLVYWEHDRDFYMIVEVQVIEGGNIIDTGFVDLRGYPDWGSVSHGVFVQTTAFRDVFIAMTGFTTVGGANLLQVTLHSKVLPLVSFVWLGVFFMVASIVPLFVQETTGLWGDMKKKEEHLYVEEESAQVVEEEPVAQQ
jgi:cytochrome c-type biogenesis protein CcmF